MEKKKQPEGSTEVHNSGTTDVKTGSSVLTKKRDAERRSNQTRSVIKDVRMSL